MTTQNTIQVINPSTDPWAEQRSVEHGNHPSKQLINSRMPIYDSSQIYQH